MSELTGLNWLNSPQNKRWERRRMAPFVRFALAGTALGGGLVFLIDRHAQPFRRAKRALLPGVEYEVTKIGTPGEHAPVSNILSELNFDELWHIILIMSGEASLIGPRGTDPVHRQRLFDCLNNGKKVDTWKTILEAQLPGLICTHSMSHHSKPGLDIHHEFTVEPLMTDQMVAEEAEDRFENDLKDVVDASPRHSADLVRQFKQIGNTKLRSVIV